MITKILSYIVVALVIFLDLATVYYCIEQMILHPVFLDVKIAATFVTFIILGAFTWFVILMLEEMREF